MRRRTVWLLVAVLSLDSTIIGAGVYRSLTPDDVPLRVGMSAGEVDKRFRQSGPGWDAGTITRTAAGRDVLYVDSDSLRFGFYRVVTVHFDEDDRVIGWDRAVWSLPLSERRKRGWLSSG